MTWLCFHAQQAAEKAIKAVLVLRGIDFPKSHDIAKLRGLLPDRSGTDSRLIEAATLTDYAVAARYPGEREPLDCDDVTDACRLAGGVLEWAEDLMSLRKPSTGSRQDPRRPTSP